TKVANDSREALDYFSAGEVRENDTVGYLDTEPLLYSWIPYYTLQSGNDLLDVVGTRGMNLVNKIEDLAGRAPALFPSVPALLSVCLVGVPLNEARTIICASVAKFTPVPRLFFFIENHTLQRRYL